MDQKQFIKLLVGEIDKFRKALSTNSGDWVVKGFIDVYKNIYTISVDTKVVSKIIELMLFPVLLRFSKKHNYKVILSEHQNHYPDMTFISPSGMKIALDMKSTYRTSANRVNGFTLGAFTGYFRDRSSKKNITFPYSEYSCHVVLGVIYSRTEADIDERKIHSIEDLRNIISVVRDFGFLVQESGRLLLTALGAEIQRTSGPLPIWKNSFQGRVPSLSWGKKFSTTTG